MPRRSSSANLLQASFSWSLASRGPVRAWARYALRRSSEHLPGLSSRALTWVWPIAQAPDGLSAEALRRSLEGIPSTLQGASHHKRIRLSMLLHCCSGPRIRLACHAALPARGALPDRSEHATGRGACLRDRVGCPAFVLAYPRSLRSERVRAPPITRPQGCVRRWVTRYGRRALRAWTC